MPGEPDLLQGTLDVLVLKALTWGPRHGHAVARMIRAASGGAFEVLDGSLYAALHRLEERECVESEWGLSEKGKRARFYTLTTRGRQLLRAESASWRRYADAVASMLSATTLPAEG
ncbi:MAG TPA: PadR family transcriptional regulator [Gemmatimonadaceae bacterium]|jgi:PadR family transcriptional regulator PadR|nr:PadR family transcriptional regulator [Gemmatimonadaceae bacterium]